MASPLHPDILVQQAFAQRVNMFVFGVTCWHYLTTLQYVELPLLRRRLKPRWTMVPYLGARYTLLGSTVGFQLDLCGPANETFWFVGCVAMIFASEILLVRALTLWRKNPCVRAFLVFCGIGHWAMGTVAFLVPMVDAWVRFASTCEISLGPTGPVPFFLYTMLLDFVVLAATVAALRRMREARSASRLWARLYRQGFLYFVLTFVVNLLIFVFACAAVDVFLADALTTPGVALSVIASSHAYISLLHMRSDPQSPVLPAPFSTAKSAPYELTTDFVISSAMMRDSGEAPRPVVICTPPSPCAAHASPHVMEVGVVRQPGGMLAPSPHVMGMYTPRPPGLE